MESSEAEAVSVPALRIVAAAGYQGEGQTLTVFELMGVKKLSGAFYSTVLLPSVFFSFCALSFHRFQGSKWRV